MKQRIYLDTSVFSALGDARAPDRQALTREFFGRLSEFDPCSSELARVEIERTNDPQRRQEMTGLLSGMTLHPITPEAQALSDRYLAVGIFPATVPDDALHVAISVLTRQDVLVSWNFKHLVNQRRRAAVQALNVSLGLPVISILPPPEL